MSIDQGIFCADFALTASFPGHDFTVFNDSIDALVAELSEGMERKGDKLTDLIDGHVFRIDRGDDPQLVCVADIELDAETGTWNIVDAADPNRPLWPDLEENE